MTERLSAFAGTRPALLLTALSLVFTCCHPAQKTTSSAPIRKPAPTVPTDKPRYDPMDTVRWAPAPAPRPPIGNAAGNVPAAGTYTGQTYHLALLLPFLTHQADTGSLSVPEKSELALQFYAGASLALQKLSSEEGLNLVVDVYDTQINDADFQRLFSQPRLDKAQVLIGPIRGSHVGLMAERIKKTRQILVSPESPSMDLTSANPDFIQINPSLRAHCAAIARHVLAQNRPDAVTLVCKQKEADRLPFFQQANSARNARFAELIVPDAATNFDNIDLRPYFRPGRKAVFILPTWASQDFVMAFLRKLHTARGATPVEVYGMPQWRNFENIEPEYFAEMNVHISSATYIDRGSAEVRAFRQTFYDAYGTVPGEDAFNGYEVTLLTGRMLKKYGLSFPGKLAAENSEGLDRQFQFAKVTSRPPTAAGRPPDNSLEQYDYLENIFVHILAFKNYKFVPAE